MVFLVSTFLLAIPRDTQGHMLFWYTAGLPFAALVRTHEKLWPVLIAASAIGIAAASLRHSEPTIEVAFRTASSLIQAGAAAWILRRRLGPYLDLTDLRHLLWLAGVTAGVAAALIALRGPIAMLIDPQITPRLGAVLLWYVMTSLSLMVLGLPVLSLTSSSLMTSLQNAKVTLDVRHGAILAVLLLLQAGMLTLSFGPMTLPGVFVCMPLLMLIAWLYGLPGAGLSNLLVTAIVGYFTYERLGSPSILERAGYHAFGSGVYLALFFAVCQLVSLPLAIARTRQMALTDELAAALAASEARAVRLEASEQAAKRAETQAVQARERLRRVIETSTDIICTLDGQGNFIDISENCEALWGLPRGAVLGRSFLDFIVPEERGRLLQLYDLRMIAPIRNTVRTNHPLPDGTIMPMSWSATWVEEDQVTHCVGRDMSEYNAMEARFHHAQRMEAIGQLTGGVAHDFNNLLTVVLGSCEAVALEIEDPHLQEMLEMALQAGEQCAELTRQLLAFARRQTLAPQAFDLNDLIASAAPLIMRTLRSDLEFSIRTSSDLRLAFADPLQTETAILNLCLNARDAMPEGGKLLIETANAALTEAYVKRNPDAKAGEYVLITVSDTGTGIAPEIIQRIFDPFFTTKDVGRGTGLGLSMVHGFVSQSDGHVKVLSKPGKGTACHLYLPAADAGATAGARHEPDARALRYGKENVLLVEDHPLVREHLLSKLQSLGYRVTVAASGGEALDILERRADIDLLLTDVVMPGGIDGFELGRQTAERWPQIRILYTSGYAPDALTDGGRRLDGVAMLAKPYSKSDLADKVRSVLDAT